MDEFAYEDGPYVCYPSETCGDATFVRVCPKCGQFVKADAEVFVNEDTGLRPSPTATCRKDGRVEMPFVGFM